MCIDIRRRSLRGQVHDRLYEYFEMNSLCTRFVQNDDFRAWMRAQNKKSDLRNRAVDDKGAHEELVELVETFVEKYDWQKELEKHAVSGIFQLLEDVGFLEEVETFRTFKVCRAMLYYHLGMIVLDQET